MANSNKATEDNENKTLREQNLGLLEWLPKKAPPLSEINIPAFCPAGKNVGHGYMAIV